MITTEASAKGPGFILRFVSAPNERELEREMLRVQIRLKGAVRWRTPLFANRKWYAWYEIDIEFDEQSRLRARKMRNG